MNRKTILIACLALTASACSAAASTTTSPEAIVQPTPRTIIVEVTPQPTPRPTPTPTPRPTPVVIEEPTPDPEPPAPPVAAVTIKGTGSKNTKPFRLEGDYTVVIKGKAADLWGGNVIAWLYPKGEDVFGDLLANEIVDDRGDKYRYETVVYEMSDVYYLDLTMPGGSWTITFTPIAGDGSAA